MNLINILVKKELIDAIRDKRSVMAGLYYALGSPLVMCGLFIVLIGQLTSPSDLKIEIKNANGAPDLVRYLDNSGISHSDDKQDRKAITLIISDDYAKNMAKGQPAKVTMITDRSNEKLRDSLRRLSSKLQVYSSEMASLRLIARGIDPKVVQPIQIQLEDQATPDSKAGLMLGIVIMSVIYAAFFSGMNLAIDTSAGERERNSLALLLSHPLTTRQIVLSKLIAVSTFAMIGVVGTLLVSKLVYPFVPWQELGFSIEFRWSMIALSILLALPIALLAASLQLFVSFLSKTFKEAQSYLGLVLILPMMLLMASSYNIVTEIMQWLPISGQQQALLAFMKGREIPMTQLLVASVSTLLIAFALVFGMEKSLKSEKVVFGL
ncbi:MAG: ABC transporter permease [Parashewanella sp.]